MPTIVVFGYLSFNAPANISDALAVPSFTSMTTGISVIIASFLDTVNCSFAIFDLVIRIVSSFFKNKSAIPVASLTIPPPLLLKSIIIPFAPLLTSSVTCFLNDSATPLSNEST